MGGFYSDRILGGEIENDLKELVRMDDMNQLRCQFRRCDCEKFKDFQRGEEQVGSLANRRVERGSIV